MDKKLKALAWDDRPEDFLEILKERLQQNKIEIAITSYVDDFDDLFYNDEDAWDFLILDVLDQTSDPEQVSKAGIHLAKRVRRSNPDIPIVFLTEDESIILSGEIMTPGPVLKMPKSYPRGMLTLDILDFVKGNLEPYDFSKVFIIYGDNEKNIILKNKIISCLEQHGVEPVLISPENVMSAISDGLVEVMQSCGALVAVCTPDDQIGASQYQPRQNVLLEIGIAMGLPRGFQRLVILQGVDTESKQKAKLPSDLEGVSIIQISDEIEEEALRQMLNALEKRRINIQASVFEETVSSLARVGEEATIRISLDLDYESFTPERGEIILKAISEYLNISNIKVSKIEPGSVKIHLSLPLAQAEKLFWAIKRGEFEDLSIKDAKLIGKATAGGLLKHKEKSGMYDVFLCHNGSDKEKIEHLAIKLRDDGIRVWLDVWELRPGLPWQRALQAQIKSISSAAVFVGSNGTGPWQDMEIDAFIREFVKRGCPVIPVLLSECLRKPELPSFLSGMTWVDFNKNKPDPMKQLVWGITGERVS